jgi:predicted  nucleic acid-binding Zn-ribbon protein
VHIVTKVLIVFCAVFCLLLSALTVSYASNADKLAKALRDEEAARLAAEAAASTELAKLGQERATFQLQIEALNNTIRAREQTIDSLQREQTNLRTEKEEAVAAAAAIRNRIDQLVATVDNQATIIKGYRDEVSALRTEQLAANRREIELIDRINDLQSQTEVLEQTTRALREQLAEAQQAVQTAMTTGGVGQARSGPFEATTPIRGRIREVLQHPAGGSLAVIDVGSQSGVRENMLLNITRGAQFIGTMVITKADPRQAVGRIQFVAGGQQVAENDDVLSLLQ